MTGPDLGTIAFPHPLDIATSLAYIANDVVMEVALVTRNVVLTDNQAELVEGLVASGRFQNASEVLRAGLRLLERQEAEIAELKSRISISLDQAQSANYAEGSGEEAIHRAFETARGKR